MPVYQYEGKHYSLPDGISDEQAISTIEDHLGVKKGPGLMDKAMNLVDKGSSIRNTLGGAADVAMEGLGDIGKTLGGLITGGKTPASPQAETGASLTTGMAGIIGGLPPAALKSINNLGQGKPGNMEQNYSDAIDSYTYYPKTERGQDMAGDAGDFISRNLIALGPMAMGLGEAMAGARNARQAMRDGTAFKRVGKPKGPDMAAFAKGVETPPPMSNKPVDINLNEGAGLPGTIPVTPEGQGVLSPQDAFFRQQAEQKAAQLRASTPAPGQGMNPNDPFAQMKSQLGSEQRINQPNPVMDRMAQDLQEPVRPPTGMEGVQQDLFGQDKPQLPLEGGEMHPTEKRPPLGDLGEGAQQGEMFGRPDLLDLQHNGEMPQLTRDMYVRGEQGEMFGRPDLLDLKESGKLPGRPINPLESASEEARRVREEQAQKSVDERQHELEFEGKKQFNLDFNAAERTRQEKAPVPGLENLKEEQRYAKVQEDTANDPRVKQAEDRLQKAQELYTKAASAMQDGLQGMNEKLLKRLDTDVKHFQESLDDLKANVEFEHLQASKPTLSPSTPDVPPRRIVRSPGNKQSGFILLESNRKKASQNLADKVLVEKKLRELAPGQKTPEQVVEDSKGAKDVDQNWFQKASNYLTKGGLYQSLKVHNPMVRYVVEKILGADRLSKADVRDWVHAKLGPAMRELNAKEQGQVWQAIELADLNQRPLDFELMAKTGFSEKQIQMAMVHQDAMGYAFDMLNKARAAAGKAPIDKRVAYAAMRASGDFRRLVYIGDEVVGIIGSDFRRNVEKLSSQLEEQGFKIGEERYFGGVPRERGSANQAFMHAIEFLAENDPKMSHFVDVLNQIRSNEVYNFLNTKTHTMQKKGIFGMEGRRVEATPEQNAKDGFKAQLNYLESAIKWGHLSEAAVDIKKVLDSKEVNMPNAKQWSERYLHNALGFNPSAVGQHIEAAVARTFESTGVGYSVGRKTMAVSRQVTNSLLLSLNPRFWATNIVQPLQAMPGVKAMLIARGLDAGFDFGTGWSYLADGGNTIMKQALGMKLDAFEKTALDYAHKNHVYGSDLVEHSNQVRKGPAYYAEKTGNAVAGSIESGTRRLVYLSLAKLLRENGMKAEHGLFEAAHNLTDITMNNYSSVERPQIYNSLGPIGDVAVNLQSYKHNELSRLALFFRHAQEFKSLRPVAAQIASGIAFTGLLGTTAFSTADQSYKAITKLMGKPDSLTNLVISLSERTNKKVNDATGVDQPYALSHGVFSALGVDMTKSLGLTDIVPTNPADLLFPGSSKLGEIATAGYDMAKSPSEMNAKRLGRAAAPIGLQGALDNQWFTKDTAKGKLAVNPQNLRGQAYRNKTDEVAKNLGFSGIHEAVQKQKTFNIEKVARDYADLRQGPLGAMRDQVFSKGTIDRGTIDKYLQYRGNPETLVTDLARYGQEQSMSAQDLAMLRNAASSAVGAKAKAADYVRMFSK